MSHGLPDEMLVGKTSGEWPIHVYPSESVAAAAMEGDRTESRLQVWRVRVEVIEEMEMVPPTRASIRPKKLEPT